MIRFSISSLTLAVFFCSHLLALAGELDPQQHKWHAHYKSQENIPRPEEMLLNTDPEPDLTDGFTSLFNGKDLKGWTSKGGTCTFEVRDGLLVGKCVPGSNSTYLSTNQADYRDFVFTCEMKWEVDGNSGVMFRAKSRTNKNGTEDVYGPQAEMEGFSMDRHWSGGIYGQSCGGYFYPLWLKEHKEARAAPKQDEWNRLTISAKSNVVKTWINGVPASYWIDDGSYPKGFFGLQIHKGAKGTVLWKNIRVKRLVSKPNVMFILADDLGWSDTTLFGTTKFYKTPNIQRLSARGMTFTHAYSASPLCSPTRASIMTGLSPARTGITSPNCHLPKIILRASSPKNAAPHSKATIPTSVSRLNTSYYTLAEVLKDHGYTTAHFGKWHLGAEPYSPLEHGFDFDVPHWPGPGPAGSYVAPWKFPDFDPQTPYEHIEDRMAEEAVQFIENHKNRPFFLNYWMFSVHAPFDAKQELIDEYKKQVDPLDSQRSPTYAAMIESMDDAVGTLLVTLDRLQIADNTIIVLATDNGGNMYNEVDGTTATSNAPLRGGKATMYEGGIRGPAIVVHPGVVKAGSRSDQLIQSCDFYPTLLELLAIEAKPAQSFDGISIVPALEGRSLSREAIFTFFPHSSKVPDWLPPAVSVHRGDWKLIRIFHGGENGKHRYKLYNLKVDLAETTNLAAEYPERVIELDALIDSFLDETEAVLPQPNPKFNPAKYQPELEGKAKIKGTGDAPKKKKKNRQRVKQPAG
ncbi:sulfatase-like hydrolase/transferase [Bythopirellula polymerisocia]|uniref:Arylsulfatase n=1 Tax=Bythopirellula polymerisocia TaxID=2528003 RepID=A0A5C6CVM8_9BACT|nr:sulfatase-like hydrolase/transferase [Bythopirellula polymerisocia]TWU28640.1 Arylsulfatase [Bythopirellula polymerisocia]